GKLPTASAVVYDVIDCARHQGKTIMCFWNQEQAKLVDIGDVERGFFVRARSEAAADIEAAFPGAERIEAEGRPQDCGYLVPPMKEREFAAKYEALGDKVLSRIRLEG
ncbi:MAG: homoserine dehydrogenase, partial [Acetatifactor sp.]|nr:homoserine dehydrogenase [Acetatifactor sp.]